MKTRKCNKCTLCCDFVGIAEIEKPEWSDCRHLCYRGCRIYKERPSACRHYSCLWAQGVLPKDLSPLVTGVVAEGQGNGVLNEGVIVLKTRDKSRLLNFEPLVLHYIHDAQVVVFFATPSERWCRGPQEKIAALKEHVRDVAGGGTLRSL